MFELCVFFGLGYLGVIGRFFRKMVIKRVCLGYRFLESGRIYLNKYLVLSGWCLNLEVWGFLG